jgi:hypothetical protein
MEMKDIKVDICWEILGSEDQVVGVQMFSSHCPIALELKAAKEDSPEPACYEYYWNPETHEAEVGENCIFYRGHTVEGLITKCSCK